MRHGGLVIRGFDWILIEFRLDRAASTYASALQNAPSCVHNRWFEKRCQSTFRGKGVIRQ
jgi:hypothetical protein